LFNPKTLATLTAFGLSALVFPEDNKVKVNLGDLNDLPENEMKRVQVGENKENYILVLKKHGRVQAFSGKCCHFGAPLDTGYFDGRKIWCPWHLAKFCSFSGELVGGPGLNSLKKYKVEK
jgi:nitrite reductase/ring-hydroxylating ferredoxin subunit